MQWIAVALVLAFAYVYAPLLRVHAARRFGLVLPVAERQAAAAALPSPAAIELPAAVVRRAAQESEPWAREETAERARALFAEHGDWNVVLQLLDA
jgi:hypothetical protein